MAGHRCTKAQAEERHSWIVEQIAAFRPRPQIVRELRQRWGISQSQALRALQRADKERVQVYDSVERNEMLSMALQAAEKAVELAIARGLPTEIIGAVRLLDQLVILSPGCAERSRSKPWHR